METATQKICEPRVFLDRKNLRAAFENEFGQRAQTRTDLDDVIIFCNLRFFYNPARKVSVVQKILSESFDRRDADLAQSCVDFRQLH